MKPLLSLVSVGIFVTSCSEPQSATSDLDPSGAIEVCLNNKLAANVSEHTKITYVSRHNGRVHSYIFDVFTDDFYPADFDPPIPITNMVVAAKMSDGYFQALREDPPKNRDDYKPLRDRFGEADDLKILDVTRKGDLTFVDRNLAIVRKSETSLPRQSYFLQDGEWVYRIISEGPPGSDLRSNVYGVLSGIDRYSDPCEAELKA